MGLAHLTSLLPASSQVGTLGVVAKYRELVRINSPNAAIDQGGAAFLEAKDRALMRLRQRRQRVRAQLDPRGALHRLRARLLEGRPTTVVASSSSSNENGGGCLRRFEEPVQLGSSTYSAAVTESNQVLRAVVLGGLCSLSKAFMHGATRFEVTGEDRMRAALDRPPGQGLITVSNHVASIDDPMVTAALLPPEYIFKPEALRWTLCATDRCFKNAAAALFFRAGKVLPVDRGAGVDQPGMRAARDRLRRGEWVHIFPEGTRSKTVAMLPARRGVGWLAAACERPPLVLPFVHSGMDKVVPRGAVLPRPRQRVRVAVGEPVVVVDLLERGRAEGWTERELHAAIADRVGAALCALKAELEGLPLEAVSPPPSTVASALAEDSLLPLIDEELGIMRRWRTRWESLGLPSLVQRMRLPGSSQQQQQLGGEEVTSSSSRIRLEQRAGTLSAAWELLRARERPAALEIFAVLSEHSRDRVRHVKELLQQSSQSPQLLKKAAVDLSIST